MSFDPDTVDDEPPEYVRDPPGGGKRLVAGAGGHSRHGLRSVPAR